MIITIRLYMIGYYGLFLPIIHQLSTLRVHHQREIIQSLREIECSSVVARIEKNLYYDTENLTNYSSIFLTYEGDVGIYSN